MATFEVWYSTGEYGKLWLEADSEEHAVELLEKVKNGEMKMTDLPKFEQNIKGSGEFEYETPENIDE
jgi:hypothetical protein